MQFVDADNLDVRSVKNTCVRLVHAGGRIIPFETYNLCYRDGQERLLDGVRAGAPSLATGLVPLGMWGR